MPGPGIYVVAVVVGVAAGIAFKEFVYDPHLAPKIERWTDAYTAYRTERRRRRSPPQSYSRVDSDDEGQTPGHKFPTEDDLELEGLIEREMHTLGREGTLRQRKLSAQEANNLEMLERVRGGPITISTALTSATQPNPFVPFVPLSPSPLRPPSATPSNIENVAVPISRLPVSQSEQRPSSRASASPGRLPTTNGGPSSSTPSELDYSASRTSLSLTDHEFAVASSRGASPFTIADDSRSGSPWSNALSASPTGLRSGASFSSDPSDMSLSAEIEHPYPISDHSLLHPTTYSQISLSNQSNVSLEHSEAYSEASFDTSFSSSVKTQSNASLDFLESDGDQQQADLADMPSPGSAPGMLSDDEWEHVSEVRRSAHL